jgi:signal transduction histidine kinase
VPLQQKPISDGGAPWILNTVAIAAATAVLAWPSSVVWTYLIVMALAGSTLRWIDLGRSYLVIPLEDGLTMLEVSVVIAALLTVSLAVGRSQDVTLAHAVANARAAAEAESRARQRTRFGALVHDEVIATLLAASHAARRTPAIGRSAQRALQRLDTFLAPRTDDLPVDAEVLEVEVRAAVTEVVDGVEFEGSFHGSSADIPGAVALAVTVALREAARNSVRHAGEGPIRRRVVMSTGGDALSVEFVDDGAGFDPDRVPVSRFGIRASILDRMHVVGGSADVTSAPGRGTTVAIGWRAAP